MKDIKQIHVDFSPSKVSELEYEILKQFCETKYALSTSEVYINTLQQIMLDVGAKKKIKEKRKDMEEVAKIMRNPPYNFNIPTYPRILRILENLESVGWIEARRPEKEKKSIMWSINDEVRNRMSMVSG